MVTVKGATTAPTGSSRGLDREGRVGRRQQVRQAHITPLQAPFELRRTGDTQIGVEPTFFDDPQDLRHVAEAFVLAQLAGQRFSRVLFILAVICIRRLWQQQARLDIDQPGGHHQEIRQRSRLHCVNRLDVIQELIGDLCQRDGGDIQLLALD